MSAVAISTYFLLAINTVTFIIYGIDKLKARRGLWRIPESTLLLLAFCGGSIGAMLGMVSKVAELSKFRVATITLLWSI